MKRRVTHALSHAPSTKKDSKDLSHTASFFLSLRLTRPELAHFDSTGRMPYHHETEVALV